MVAKGCAGSSVQGKPHPGENSPTQTIFSFWGGSDCCGSPDWRLPDTLPAELDHTIDQTKWEKIKADIEKGSRDNFFTECEVSACSLCLCFLVCCMLHNEEAKREMIALCQDVTKYQLKNTGLLVEFIDWEKDGKKGDSVVFRHAAKGGAAKESAPADTAPGAAN